MGTFYCYKNNNFDPICPNTSCSQSPNTAMLHVKIDHDWPTEIFKLDSADDVRGTTDQAYTISSLEPLAQVSLKAKLIKTRAGCHQRKSIAILGQIKKICVFRVILPYLIFLMKPGIFFMLSQSKRGRWYWDKIFMWNIWTRMSEQTV